MRNMDIEMKNSCETYFTITGDFDPDKVTELLGLQPDPDGTWKKEDLHCDGRKVYVFSRWSFGRCEEYDVIVAEQMKKTIAPLLDKIELLNRIRTEYEASLCLEIVPTIYVGEETPCLAPTLDVIDFCHATRTEIDIDLYHYV